MTDLQELPPLLTIKQLAELTGEHIGSIRRGIKEKRIPADKVNGKIYISTALIFPNAFLAAGGKHHER